MPDVAAAYRHCEALARSHYENFPVASHILPRHLRAPVAVVYAFARTADDLADEGDADPAIRLACLDAYGAQLSDTLAGRAPDDPVFLALADVIHRFRIPPQLFHDLLSAFRQDVTQRRYRDFAAVLDYCRRSADPVGRILLHLDNSATPENLQLSDRICSALQLINFLQDLAQDYDENDRIYIPQEEMQQAGVTEEHFASRRNDAAMDTLIRGQRARARAMMLEGAPLGRRLSGRFGLEIRLIVEGGLRVLQRLDAAGDVFARPRLRRRDYLMMVANAVMRWRRPVPTRPAREAAR